MESGQPPVGSQVSRVPAQRTPPFETDAPPVASPPVPTRPRRRLRLVLTIVAAGLGLFLLIGAAVAYVVYDRATGPDRSAPDVVVHNYLQAYLVDRNEVQASLYACSGDGRNLTTVEAFRADLINREQRFQVPLVVRWGSLDIQEAGGSAEVRVRLTITAVVSGQTQREEQAWRFGTRLEDDWRVCTAARED